MELILLRTAFAQIILRYGLRVMHVVTYKGKLVIGWEVNRIYETVRKPCSKGKRDLGYEVNSIIMMMMGI